MMRAIGRNSTQGRLNGMVARAALALALCAALVRAETTDDYIQDGLVACWDGVENAGRLTHESDTTNWVDVVGGRIFRMNKATVRDNAMYFGGAKVSNVYPQGFLNADDTAATFGQIKSGTLEIVLRAEKNANQTALQASPGMLVLSDANSTTIWTANAATFTWTCALFNWYNATNTLSILYCAARRPLFRHRQSVDTKPPTWILRLPRDPLGYSHTSRVFACLHVDVIPL